MGGKGPKPKPTILKIMEGNPGKRRLNRAEPKPAPGRPDPPRELGVDGLAEWNRIVPELEALKLLTLIDRAALVGYCAAFEAWTAAKRRLNRDGRFYKRDGVIRRHPAAISEREALNTMLRYLAEFGMSPSSRSRVQSGANEQFTDAEAAKIIGF
mgnify:CR=1 FL=1